MSEDNFRGLGNKASLDSLELSSPQNAPGNDKKKMQLPILSNVGKVLQDFYSLAAPACQRRGITLHTNARVELQTCGLLKPDLRSSELRCRS